MAGINATLYGQPEKFLTRKEVMDNLHIKNIRSFVKLIEEKDLPYMKVGKKYLVPLSQYNNWLRNNIIN